jgi:hypothetical protein
MQNIRYDRIFCKQSDRLETLSCSQKGLALRLGVSPTQISKWKQGEYMSSDMEEKFRTIINSGDKSPSFVLSAGSLEAAKKWETLNQVSSCSSI